MSLGEPAERAVAAGEHLVHRRRSRKADHPPADLAAVAAIDRVGIETLARVQDQQRHERQIRFSAGLLQRWRGTRRAFARGQAVARPRRLTGLVRRQVRLAPFDAGQHAVLLLRRQRHEVAPVQGGAAAVEVQDAGAIGLAQPIDPGLPGVGLRAGQRLEPAAVRLGVDVPDAGQVAVDEFDGAGLPRPRLVVGRDDARHRRLDGGARVVVEVAFGHGLSVSGGAG